MIKPNRGGTRLCRETAILLEQQQAACQTELPARVGPEPSWVWRVPQRLPSLAMSAAKSPRNRVSSSG